MMQLGAEGVFVGSGIFKSGNPEKRAAAIVKAVTNFTDAKLLAELSEDLGEAMVGINEQENRTPDGGAQANDENRSISAAGRIHRAEKMLASLGA